MFGFGKSSKSKSSKRKKSKKTGKKADDDKDFYQPQPVSLQRNWGTGTNKKAKKAKKPKPQPHKSQNSGSNSMGKKPSAASEPPQPDNKSQSALTHSTSVHRLENEPAPSQKPKPAPPTQITITHSQTMPKLYNNNNNNLNYEHKLNESIDSNISSQSAPLYNNYHYNKQPPPPSSALGVYNTQGYAPKHRPMKSNKLSEGISQPQTGSPEVVGDISSWKALQKQKQPPQQPAATYPNLHARPPHGGDGANQTGYDRPGLSQSRTSATGIQSGIGAISGINNDDNSYRIRSAADDPQTIIPSQISAYNPNIPAPTVPEESSSSEDNELNILMSGKAFDNDADDEEEEDDAEADKIKQAQQMDKKAEIEKKAQEKEEKEPEKKEQKEEKVQEKEEQKEEVKEVEKEEEIESSSSDDDGGLSDWLLLIGFKKKKLALMLLALSELGLDTMFDLETLLIDLYKNSYGNQQKQWMDKIQTDLMSQGIKYAQWIRFSTKAQSMIEAKVKKQQQASNEKENKEDEQSKASAKKISDNITGTVAGSGFIVMQSEEAAQLEALRNAMSYIYGGIENLDANVLSVETAEKAATDLVEKEFRNLLRQIEQRKNMLLSQISRVSEDKSGLLSTQNTLLRSIAAQYEENLHEFQSILANNQNIRGKNQITKRQNKLINLVQNVLQKYRAEIESNIQPQCTSLIGFHCNITPIVLELNKLGLVTWGNPPQSPFIVNIATTDWSITIVYTYHDQARNKKIASDPIIAYEIQCVLCKNEENLLWNFEYEMKKTKKERDRKHKKKHGVIDHGIITKQVTASPGKNKCVLLGFVVENKDYVLRMRCQNRNGWSAYSKCVLCRTKKKKKRKVKLINKLKVIRHRGSTQDGSPNNLLFNNEKSLYQSLSNQDFINEFTNYKRMNKNNKQFTDWMIFDLGTFIELITFKIKFDALHYRWGNVPKLIYIDIASYDDHSYSSAIIKKYKPISYDDDYHNPADMKNMSGVLVQLRKKRLEAEKTFESIWNRLAIIECKKKNGWQDFNLYENIDESKRKGQYIRIQFVNNFECNIEHYSKFVVEQIGFVGIQYDD